MGGAVVTRRDPSLVRLIRAALAKANAAPAQLPRAARAMRAARAEVRAARDALQWARALYPTPHPCPCDRCAGREADWAPADERDDPPEPDEELDATPAANCP